jgi:hypothetical protein
MSIPPNASTPAGTTRKLDATDLDTLSRMFMTVSP